MRPFLLPAVVLPLMLAAWAGCADTSLASGAERSTCADPALRATADEEASAAPTTPTGPVFPGTGTAAPSEPPADPCARVTVTAKRNEAAGGCLSSEGGRCLPNPERCERLDLVLDPLTNQLTETCTTADGVAITRSGLVQSAVCSESSNAAGEACRVCALEPQLADAGVSDELQVVADGCRTPQPTAPLRCESLRTRDGLTCQACTDGTGQVVRRDCDPAGTDRCEPFVDPALGLCRRCRDASGATTGIQCEPLEATADTARCGVVRLTSLDEDVAPRTCRFCQADDGKLTQYACASPVAVAEPLCSTFVDVEGADCTVCQDMDTGVEVSRSCQRRPPVGVRCFTLQDLSGGPRCHVCEDENGRLVSRSCAAEGCLPGSQDENCAPTACAVRETLERGICDICADLDQSGTVDEADLRCATPSALPVVCTTEPERNRPASECRVCRRGQVEISRACDNTVGESPALSCGQLSLPLGEVCTLCIDTTGLVRAETCSETLTVSTQAAAWENGVVASCEIWSEAPVPCTTDEECGQGQVCGVRQLCFFPTELQNVDRIRRKNCVANGTEVCNLGLRQEGACGAESAQWMVMLPRTCNNPWETWFEANGGQLPVDATGQGDVLRQWLSSVHGVTLRGHRLEMGGAWDSPPNCVGAPEPCACPRGEALYALAATADLHKLAALGFSLAP
ncbi:MAG: hypothetical protein AB2A00_31585 [Myxococcota bacterium]